jgi:NAD(P)-dependent dehydrogenase (short-subunit alcohol dehydrogenase family)
MTPRYQGKTAVVTGGASGIGEATARRLASEGAVVVVLDSDAAKAAAVAKDIGGSAIEVDVSSPVAVAQAFASIERVDVLVNSAGIANVGDILTVRVDDFDRVYSVNVKGTFLTMQAALPLMIRQGAGAIVNLASTASKIGIADRFAYSMSKGAVYTMTLSVARDFVARKIRVNCVCPARIHTPFVDGYIAKNYPDNREEMFEKLSLAQPIGRMGRPEEVAGLIAYLGSDEASFVTGAAYDFDGGFTLLR